MSECEASELDVLKKVVSLVKELNDPDAEFTARKCYEKLVFDYKKNSRLPNARRHLHHYHAWLAVDKNLGALSKDAKRLALLHSQVYGGGSDGEQRALMLNAKLQAVGSVGLGEVQKAAAHAQRLVAYRMMRLCAHALLMLKELTPEAEKALGDWLSKDGDCTMLSFYYVVMKDLGKEMADKRLLKEYQKNMLDNHYVTANLNEHFAQKGTKKGPNVALGRTLFGKLVEISYNPPKDTAAWLRIKQDRREGPCADALRKAYGCLEVAKQEPAKCPTECCPYTWGGTGSAACYEKLACEPQTPCVGPLLMPVPARSMIRYERCLVGCPKWDACAVKDMTEKDASNALEHPLRDVRCATNLARLIAMLLNEADSLLYASLMNTEPWIAEKVKGTRPRSLGDVEYHKNRLVAYKNACRQLMDDCMGRMCVIAGFVETSLMPNAKELFAELDKYQISAKLGQAKYVSLHDDDPDGKISLPSVFVVNDQADDSEQLPPPPEPDAFEEPFSDPGELEAQPENGEFEEEEPLPPPPPMSVGGKENERPDFTRDANLKTAVVGPDMHDSNVIEAVNALEGDPNALKQEGLATRLEDLAEEDPETEKLLMPSSAQDAVLRKLLEVRKDLRYLSHAYVKKAFYKTEMISRDGSKDCEAWERIRSLTLSALDDSKTHFDDVFEYFDTPEGNLSQGGVMKALTAARALKIALKRFRMWLRVVLLFWCSPENGTPESYVLYGRKRYTEHCVGEVEYWGKRFHWLSNERYPYLKVGECWDRPPSGWELAQDAVKGGRSALRRYAANLMSVLLGEATVSSEPLRRLAEYRRSDEIPDDEESDQALAEKDRLIRYLEIKEAAKAQTEFLAMERDLRKIRKKGNKEELAVALMLMKLHMAGLGMMGQWSSEWEVSTKEGTIAFDLPVFKCKENAYELFGMGDDACDDNKSVLQLVGLTDTVKTASATYSDAARKLFDVHGDRAYDLLMTNSKYDVPTTPSVPLTEESERLFSNAFGEEYTRFVAKYSGETEASKQALASAKAAVVIKSVLSDLEEVNAKAQNAVNGFSWQTASNETVGPKMKPTAISLRRVDPYSRIDFKPLTDVGAAFLNAFSKAESGLKDAMRSLGDMIVYANRFRASAEPAIIDRMRLDRDPAGNRIWRIGAYGLRRTISSYREMLHQEEWTGRDVLTVKYWLMTLEALTSKTDGTEFSFDDARGVLSHMQRDAETWEIGQRKSLRIREMIENAVRGTVEKKALSSYIKEHLSEKYETWFFKENAAHAASLFERYDWLRQNREPVPVAPDPIRSGQDVLHYYAKYGMHTRYLEHVENALSSDMDPSVLMDPSVHERVPVSVPGTDLNARLPKTLLDYAIQRRQLRMRNMGKPYGLKMNAFTVNHLSSESSASEKLRSLSPLDVLWIPDSPKKTLFEKETADGWIPMSTDELMDEFADSVFSLTFPRAARSSVAPESALETTMERARLHQLLVLSLLDRIAKDRSQSKKYPKKRKSRLLWWRQALTLGRSVTDYVGLSLKKLQTLLVTEPLDEKAADREFLKVSGLIRQTFEVTPSTSWIDFAVQISGKFLLYRKDPDTYDDVMRFIEAGELESFWYDGEAVEDASGITYETPAVREGDPNGVSRVSAISLPLRNYDYGGGRTWSSRYLKTKITKSDDDADYREPITDISDEETTVVPDDFVGVRWRRRGWGFPYYPRYPPYYPPPWGWYGPPPRWYGHRWRGRGPRWSYVGAADRPTSTQEEESDAMTVGAGFFQNPAAIEREIKLAASAAEELGYKKGLKACSDRMKASKLANGSDTIHLDDVEYAKRFRIFEKYGNILHHLYLQENLGNPSVIASGTEDFAILQETGNFWAYYQSLVHNPEFLRVYNEEVVVASREEFDQATSRQRKVDGVALSFYRRRMNAFMSPAFYKENFTFAACLKAWLALYARNDVVSHYWSGTQSVEGEVMGEWVARSGGRFADEARYPHYAAMYFTGRLYRRMMEDRKFLYGDRWFSFGMGKNAWPYQERATYNNGYMNFKKRDVSKYVKRSIEFADWVDTNVKPGWLLLLAAIDRNAGVGNGTIDTTKMPAAKTAPGIMRPTEQPAVDAFGEGDFSSERERDLEAADGRGDSLGSNMRTRTFTVRDRLGGLTTGTVTTDDPRVLRNLATGVQDNLMLAAVGGVNGRSSANGSSLTTGGALGLNDLFSQYRPPSSELTYQGTLDSQRANQVKEVTTELNFGLSPNAIYRAYFGDASKISDRDLYPPVNQPLFFPSYSLVIGPDVGDRGIPREFLITALTSYSVLNFQVEFVLKRIAEGGDVMDASKVDEIIQEEMCKIRPYKLSVKSKMPYDHASPAETNQSDEIGSKQEPEAIGCSSCGGKDDEEKEKKKKNQKIEETYPVGCNSCGGKEEEEKEKKRKIEEKVEIIGCNSCGDPNHVETEAKEGDATSSPLSVGVKALSEVEAPKTDPTTTVSQKPDVNLAKQALIPFYESISGPTGAMNLEGPDVNQSAAEAVGRKLKVNAFMTRITDMCGKTAACASGALTRHLKTYMKNASLVFSEEKIAKCCFALMFERLKARKPKTWEEAGKLALAALSEKNIVVLVRKNGNESYSVDVTCSDKTPPNAKWFQTPITKRGDALIVWTPLSA